MQASDLETARDLVVKRLRLIAIRTDLQGKASIKVGIGDGAYSSLGADLIEARLEAARAALIPIVNAEIAAVEEAMDELGVEP